MNTPKQMRHGELVEAYERLSTAFDRLIQDYRTLEEQYELSQEQFRLMTRIKTRDIARDILEGTYGGQKIHKEE